MKLLLIDGSNLIFRAYYATEKREILTPDNLHANAIYTLVSMINKMVEEHKPTHMFIALDTGKSTFRHEQYPEYKGKRTETPDRLKEQFALAKELYDAMGIKHYATERFEADDLIASYAEIAKQQGFKVQIVSGDKDLLQLIDENVSVLTPAMGFAKECNYTPEVFEEKYGFAINRFIEFKALVGDSSDNIIGIEKIGQKTATKFINNFASLNDMVAEAQAVMTMVENKEKVPKEKIIKGKNAERMAVAKQQLDNNLELVELVRNVDVHIPLSELEFSDYNYETYIKYLKRLGFSRFVTQFSNKAGINEEKVIEHQHKVKDIMKFDPKKHTGKETFIYTETLGENYHETRSLGIALSSKKGIFYLPATKIDQTFIDYLKSDSKKITYNLKRLMVISNVTHVNNVIFDIYLASALINPDNYKKPLEALAMQYQLDYIENQRELYGPKSNPVMPMPGALSHDMGMKAQTCNELYIQLVNEIETNELMHVLHEIELPLSQVLARMEIQGIILDQEKLHNLSQDYEIELEKIEQKISLITDINIKSPKQLSEYFFETCEAPTKGIKKTKSGFSTDVENLLKLQKLLQFEQEKFQEQIKLIDLIMEHRIYSKLNSTYIKGLDKYIHEGRIHPIYHQLLTETGRLSVSDPNIQNIPIRTQKGQVIRSLFTAPAGYQVVAIDYSQVELRIIADMAKEQNMIDEFLADNDIHTETAKKILNVQEVSSSERSQAKAINFGIIYGMSAFGLAKQVGLSKGQAQEFIDKYLATYPRISGYMEELVEFAKENGYVKTLFGRRRNLENINSNNKMEFEAAKRMAINTPIQGTAADVIKMAMIKIDEYCLENDIQMVMQIHDELVFYVKDEEVQKVQAELVGLMESIVDLAVNLKAEANHGYNWLEAK